MKYLTRFFIGLLVTAMTVACGGNAGSDDKQSQRTDSLLRANAMQQADLEDMASFVAVLADGLDSIAKQENMLFFSNQGPEGTGLDRNQLKKNLEMFGETLAKQRNRIKQMSDSLKAKGANIDKLEKLVAYLNQQLEEKDKTIRQLQADVEQKNLSIADLQKRLSTIDQNYAALSQRAAAQEEQMARYTTAYVLMGTADALIDAGYIDKRKRVMEDMPMDDFTKVNIENTTELEIPSRSVKLVTDHPKKSYKIEKVDKETRRLVILNPNMFWANSRYLIIVIK